jgi:hypothetical protein
MILSNEADKRDLSPEEYTVFCIKPFLETPLQLILIMISSKGQTFILKEIIFYTETAYIYRLFQSFHDAFSDSKFLYKVFHDLYLSGDGRGFDTNNFLPRNRILQRVLQKKPILAHVEQFAFHKSLKQAFPYLGNLLEFTRHYQLIIQEECGMTKDQVEVAVKLGQQIVISAKPSSSNFDRVKGDLFTLRKTRTVTDFLEQLNRIQFRYNLIVSNQILGGIIDEKIFEDFKSYCLLAALNTYNNFKRSNASAQQAN